MFFTLSSFFLWGVGFIVGALVVNQIITSLAKSFYKHEKTGSSIPGPSLFYTGYRVIRGLLVRTHLCQEIFRVQQNYGTIFHMFVGPRSSIVVSDPEAVRKILLNTRSYPKHNVFTNEKLHQFWGKNVLVVEGDSWKRQRHIMNPAFADIGKFINAFAEKVSLCMESWEMPSPFSQKISKDTFKIFVKPFMQRMTLDVLGRTVFGYEFNYLKGELSQQLDQYNYIMQQAFNIFRTVLKWVYYFPLPSNFKVDAAMKAFDKLTLSLIQQARQRHAKIARGEEVPDQSNNSLLDMMINAQLEEGVQALTDQEIRDNIIVFFIAGHETGAYTMCFAMYLLSKHKEIQEKAREEVLRVLGPASTSRIPTYEQLKQLDYLRCVINETMRIFPPISVLNGREQQKDDVVCGYKLPKGTAVQVFIYGLHHSPELWGDPEVFRPERFYPEESKGRPPIAFIPFSSGPRTCIGNHFAMCEMMLFLANVLQRYELLESDPNYKMNFAWGNLVVSPSDDLAVNLKKL